MPTNVTATYEATWIAGQVDSFKRIVSKVDTIADGTWTGEHPLVGLSATGTGLPTAGAKYTVLLSTVASGVNGAIESLAGKVSIPTLNWNVSFIEHCVSVIPDSVMPVLGWADLMKADAVRTEDVVRSLVACPTLFSKPILIPHDLAALPLLPKLIVTGIHAFKIEGRLKPPEYVAEVRKIYREALDYYAGAC